MALDAEFKKHLHSLMVEVYESTISEIEQHKRELVFKAHQTHNGAAPPIAYKDAALYAMEFRLSRTIEKYIEAVSIWGYSIDPVFERDMINEFQSLTAGPNQVQFPPAIKGQHAQAVQGSYARERSRLAAQLVREGTNRLRELKMKKKQSNPVTSNITNNFNAPVGNAFINSSVVQTTNNFTITTQQFQDIELISEGNQELQAAALEIRNAQNQGVGILDKFQKWTTLVNTVAGLADKVHQYYPQIEALIKHL
ncbi:MAG: hypothetical protein WA634_01540 [Silvibacterium sp.]